MKAILLAAGRGRRLQQLTDDRPKCLVEVHGVSLLDWQLAALRATGIDDVVVVRGYGRGRVGGAGLRFVDNPRWDSTNMVESLRCASHELRGDVLVVYTDLLYLPSVVQTARSCQAPIGVVIDRDWLQLWNRRMDDPLDDAETLRLTADGRITEIGQPPDSLDDIHGQYIGMIRLSPAGSDLLRCHLERSPQSESASKGSDRPGPSPDSAFMTDLLSDLIEQGVSLHAVPIHGGWTEVDSPSDLRLAHALVREPAWKPLRQLVDAPALRMLA